MRKIAEKPNQKSYLKYSICRSWLKVSMPEWVFFNIPLHYLMTPIFTFGRKACHRMPASIHLCGIRWSIRESCCLGCLYNVLPPEKEPAVSTDQLTTHPSVPHQVLAVHLPGCVSQCPWSSDCPHLPHAGITLPQVQMALPSCFLLGAYLVTLPLHCGCQSRKLSPGGIPPPFGKRNQWVIKYPRLLE